LTTLPELYCVVPRSSRKITLVGFNCTALYQGLPERSPLPGSTVLRCTKVFPQDHPCRVQLYCVVPRSSHKTTLAGFNCTVLRCTKVFPARVILRGCFVVVFQLIEIEYAEQPIHVSSGRCLGNHHSRVVVAGEYRLAVTRTTHWLQSCSGTYTFFLRNIGGT
jgi:hypothetical protein